MKRFVALALAVICGVSIPLWEMVLPTIAPAYAHPAAYQHDHFVVPGERIGPLRIGMTTNEARAILRSMGEYSQAGPTSMCSGGWSGTCVGERWLFGDDSRDKAVHTPGRVLWVGTVETKYKTREGLGVGDDLVKFYNRYGTPPYSDSSWDEWWYRGLVVKTGWFFVYQYAAAVIVIAPQPGRDVPYPVQSP